MRLSRRAWLLALPGWAGAQTPDPADAPVQPGRALQFPRDHGAHPRSRIEWWYATGWLETGAAPLGFQLTFFRSRTGLADELPSRFAPRQLLLAHAALSDIAAGRHLHAQQLTRWSGDPMARDAAAATQDTAVHLRHWQLRREAGAGAAHYVARIGGSDAPFELQLRLAPSQPLLLQGESGWSRKGPSPQQASHYYSLPQLQVRAQLLRAGQRSEHEGRAWLDHEWSDELMPPDAVGWDWIGINLADGGALTAFRLRRRDGSALWAGGSHRGADGKLRVFTADEVQFVPQRSWSSPTTLARYPVQWEIRTPAGRHGLRALLDAQELDGRAGSGAVYWEGLSEMLDERGRPVGRGYLEMTGYAQPLRL